MKVYTIGRGESNAIHVDNEFVSRQHAILKVYSSGKMEIIDKSSNGTAINGRKIKSNTPYRVRRKDVVTFAGQAHLDWKEIPDPLKGYKIALLCVLIAGVLLAAFLIARPYLFKDKPVDLGGGGGYTPPQEQKAQPADSTKKESEVDVETEIRKMKEQERKKKEAEKKKKEEAKKKKADEAKKAEGDSTATPRRNLGY
jgi:pSer/pThr/pTyr-binding forkhead associated (FHA) protein